MSPKHFLLPLSLSLFVLTSFSGVPGQTQDKQEAREAALREADEKRRNQQRLEELENVRRKAHPPPTRKTRVIKETYKLTSRDKKLLAPAAEDQRMYANFLRQPETGLFRLLPYPVDNAGTVSAAQLDKPQVLTTGVGAFYSFSKRRYGYDKSSEVFLQAGLLKAGVAAESLGLLITLGNVPVESVMPSSPGVAELSGFMPATDYTSAAKQFAQSKAAFKIGSFAYRASLPPLINTTYVLRSISYGRSDVLIVFRVLREESDGGLTILWKKISTYPVQSLRSKP